MLDAEGRSLRGELFNRFRRPIASPLPDAEFDALARRIFAWQFARNAPYAQYCRSRGRTPDSVASWHDIPAVPTAAFREVTLAAGDPADAEAVFRTSGTTAGRRGTHVILDLAAYHGSLVPNFRAHLVPDVGEIVMLSLIPPPRDVPDSSLSHMVSIVMERLGADGSRWFASAAGLATEALEATLDACTAKGRPVLLLGTSFAFVHWTDALRARGVRFRLPAGSRLMDTGGYKGRSREVGVEELRETYVALLGIHRDLCVNEYGMTELCSQFYDTTLHERAGGGAVGERRKRPPPWVRTTIVDPDTLDPAAPGESGLLRHVDLANLGSVIAVQTEDVGEAVEDGFRVLGRAAGAQPRGCSLAMEELLRATRASV